MDKCVSFGKRNWIGHILHTNCLLKHAIEWKLHGNRRRGRRRKQLLHDLKDIREYLWLETEAYTGLREHPVLMNLGVL